MPDTESRRYASDRAGIIHEVVDADFRARRPAYLALCGERIEVHDAEVSRSREPPGMLCRQCAMKSEERTPPVSNSASG
jgi:hypothetical protein